MICSKCEKEAEFYSTISNMCKACYNKYRVNQMIQRKIDSIKYKGSKCIRCSITLEESHYSIFDFHHRDPNNKDMNWDIMRKINKKKLKEELDKCDLLCSNCHRITHALLRNPELDIKI